MLDLLYLRVTQYCLGEDLLGYNPPPQWKVAVIYDIQQDIGLGDTSKHCPAPFTSSAKWACLECSVLGG
jgi:hypothetical protein